MTACWPFLNECILYSTNNVDGLAVQPHLCRVLHLFISYVIMSLFTPRLLYSALTIAPSLHPFLLLRLPSILRPFPMYLYCL